MPDETVAAESSAAAAAAPEAAAEPKFTEFDGWDEDGTPVVRQKPEGAQKKPDGADSATAAGEKKGTDDAADSAAKKTQEKTRKPDVEQRFKKLTEDHKAEVARLQRELEEARKPKETKADSSTARQTEQKPAEPAATRPKPTFTEKGADGKAKYTSYEDFVEDLADWKTEQRMAAQERERQTAELNQAVGKRLQEARDRYEDFDTKAKPIFLELMKPDMPPEVIGVLDKSPVLPDVLYTLGGTEAVKNDFLDACRTDPAKALRVALLVEQEIVKELAATNRLLHPPNHARRSRPRKWEAAERPERTLCRRRQKRATSAVLKRNKPAAPWPRADKALGDEGCRTILQQPTGSR
jgi:hypothetical protein